VKAYYIYGQQVYLVHSCGCERRVSAELYVDSNDYVKPGQGQGSEVKANVKMKVKLSIPACYGMDVYVAPQDNSTAVAGTVYMQGVHCKPAGCNWV